MRGGFLPTRSIPSFYQPLLDSLYVTKVYQAGATARCPSIPLAISYTCPSIKQVVVDIGIIHLIQYSESHERRVSEQNRFDTPWAVRWCSRKGIEFARLGCSHVYVVCECLCSFNGQLTHPTWAHINERWVHRLLPMVTSTAMEWPFQRISLVGFVLREMVNTDKITIND